MSHTPGPWRVEGVPSPAPERRGSFEVVVDVPGEQYAVIAARGQWTHRANESEANAFLIAAAPDLLAALRDASGGYCFHCRTVGENSGQSTCPETPSCGDREQMWWGAIAKAVRP